MKPATTRRLQAAFAAALLAFAGASHAAIQSQSRNAAGTVAAGGSWANANNAASINGSCALGDGSTSTSLTLTNWGFSIPAGATVLGVTVRSVSSFNDVSTQDRIRLVKAGAQTGSFKTLNGPGSTSIPGCGNPIGGPSGLTVGGTADLWGATLTPAEVNAANFGVFYDNDFSNTAVDGVDITVTYNDNVSVTVTPSAGPHGTIAPSTPQSVVTGTTTQFTVTPDPGYYATVGGTCGGSLAGTTYTTGTITAACTVAATFLPIVRGDTGGDGRADLFWREAAPGTGLSWWAMNGAVAGAASYFAVGAEWQVADVGDLDGDRKADIVWRRGTDGATYLWRLDGLAPAAFADLGILDPAAWTLVGAADLDGDGRADLVWRGADGTVYGWLMNAGAIASQGVIGNPGADWAIVDLADMDGNGRADLVFRNAASGQVFTWFMNGLALASAASPGTLDPATWQLLAAADFSGDGKADLLWRSTAGDTWVWVMNGASFVSGASIGNPGAGWTIRSVADFDGDGKADLVWRHTDGTAYYWKMNGAAVSSATPVANPGGTWQVIAP